MPDKHEVGGSSPLGPTTVLPNKVIQFKISLVIFLYKESNMLIENRIRIMKRTDSCILRKTCYIKY